MLSYTIMPGNVNMKKHRSGKLRMRLRVFDKETNKTYARRSTVNLTVSYIMKVMEKVKNHIEEIKNLENKLGELRKMRI